MSEDKTYNGWKNYETWYIAHWIGNDEGLYNLAKECRDYAEFREQIEEINSLRVAWNDSGLDVQALDEMITENKGE